MGIQIDILNGKPSLYVQRGPTNTVVSILANYPRKKLEQYGYTNLTRDEFHQEGWELTPRFQFSGWLQLDKSKYAHRRGVISLVSEEFDSILTLKSGVIDFIKGVADLWIPVTERGFYGRWQVENKNGLSLYVVRPEHAK